MGKDAVPLFAAQQAAAAPTASRSRNALLLALSGAAAFVLLRPHVLSSHEQTATPLRVVDPADEWQDNIWPFRQPTPWDISTDYPHPRKLSYEVKETTWSNLDVHPLTGEIVFDVLGDLYCLVPGSSTAHPILRGVPQDTEPSFDPRGDFLAFRSDAELGLDNIWVVPWSGCENMSLRSDAPSDAFSQALLAEDEDRLLLAHGVAETAERKSRRLLREGRSSAYRVTNETFRFVSNPRWHPSGSTIVATKWYTGSRSLGAGESWVYDVPAADGKVHPVGIGAGKRVVGRVLPGGWPAELYNEQQIGPEQAIWAGEDAVIYSKNVIDTSGQFIYSKDVHSGIYAIFQKNLTTGRTTQLVSSYPGGASRPQLSRDGKTLAFVRRVRDKEALVFRDLASGTLTHIWYGLTYDVSGIYAPMGTYPTFAFTPNDRAVIIWAAGRIWNVPLSKNEFGQKVAGGAPTPFEFTVPIEKYIAETIRPETNLVDIEAAHHQRLYAFSEPAVNEAGDAVLINAAGTTYLQRLDGSKPLAVPALHPESAYYSPSFVPHRETLVIHARWHDTEFTTLELADVTSGAAVSLTGLPLGRYQIPTLCQCTGSSRRIAFVRFGGSDQTGNIVATAGTGLYIGDISLPVDLSAVDSLAISNVKLVSSEINSGPLILRFLDGASRLLVQRGDSALTIDLSSAGKDVFGGYAQTTVANGRMSTEIAVSSHHVAFVDQQHVHVAPLKSLEGGKAAWAKPGNATHGIARLSLDGGHDIRFSGDGQRLFWLLGPYLHSLQLIKLGVCSKAASNDDLTFGIDCIKNLVDMYELKISYESKARASSSDGYLVVKNATLLTMTTGDSDKDVIRNGVLVARGGIIEQVGKESQVSIPDGATVIDAEGGIVTPGFIDVHAHWNGHFGWPFPLPARDWQHVAFLAYGITTLHNPSFDNAGGYIERALVESGRIIAPRIVHTGGVIYGADLTGLHHEIVDMDQAREALTRIKAEGGPASFSYKNYQLPSRAARQRLLLTAKNMSMLAVPEGGMNFHWDLTYIADGMATVEHNIPIPVLHDDVLNFYALSGTAATPTHIVDYGIWGQELLWQSRSMADDEKLRRFIPHEMLQALTESTVRPLHSYALFNVSASIAEFVHRGGLANLGAHGQPPVGLMYHAEASFFAAGGLTPYEVLRAATRDGARSIGVYNSVGSLSEGKFADFLVYNPHADVLDDISHSTEIKYVARSGRVWEAETMAEYWPQKGKLAPMPPVNAD